MLAGKRLGSASPAAARELGRARVWQALLLAAFALAAYLAGGVVGYLLAYLAVLFIVDRLWPMTGLAMNDAQRAFARLARRRRGDAIARRLRHHPAEEGRLLHLDDEFEAAAERRSLGIEAISLDSIVGTTEADKAQAFDRSFRPPKWSRGRWQLIWIACSRGTPLPPISVYRVGDRHYVRDGHHRVSVARALGAPTIEAEIVQLRPLARLQVGDRPPVA